MKIFHPETNELLQAGINIGVDYNTHKISYHFTTVHNGIIAKIFTNEYYILIERCHRDYDIICYFYSEKFDYNFLQNKIFYKVIEESDDINLELQRAYRACNLQSFK